MKYVPPKNSTDPNVGYVNGNPATATQGSIPPAAAFEEPQREIVNMITDSQQVPTDQDLHQMTRAIRDGKLLWCVDSGPTNQLQIPTLMPILLSYTPGLTLHVLVAHTVTGPTTISVGSLNPTAIKRRDGSELQANDMMAGQVATIVSDGTFFQLQNLGVGGAAGGVGGQFKVDIPYVHDTGVQDPNQATATFKNHLIGLYSPALPDINEGRTVEIKLDQNILGPTDFAPNAWPIHPVAHPDGSPIVAGDGVPNQIWLLVFDGVEWQLLDVYASTPATIPAAPSAYVGRSLQFADPNSPDNYVFPYESMPYFKRTPSVQSNRQIWTQSAFLKFPVPGYYEYYYTASFRWAGRNDMLLMQGGDSAASWGGGAGDFTGAALIGSDQNLPVVNIYWAYGYAILSGQSNPGAYQSDMHPGNYTQGPLGLDSKWHHCMLVADGAFMTFYVDGVIASQGALPGPGGQINSTINTTRGHTIGTDANTVGHNSLTRNRMAEFVFIDGQALSWDKFAKVVNGSYVPIDNALNLGLNFGTNGFYLNWQDSSAATSTTLGKDWSGNNNNWTPVNFDPSRVYNDFPGNPTS
jgi:hypothetical protein